MKLNYNPIMGAEKNVSDDDGNIVITEYSYFEK